MTLALHVCNHGDPSLREHRHTYTQQRRMTPLWYDNNNMPGALQGCLVKVAFRSEATSVVADASHSVSSSA